MADRSARSGAGFGPTVVAGVGGSVLAAVASAQRWLQLDGASSQAGAEVASGYVAPWATAAEVPLASAVALVLVACWGVLLVTRGRVRRLLACLAAAAATVLVVTVAWAWRALPDRVLEATRGEVGVVAGSTGSDLSWTGWWWAALAGALVSAVAAALAVASAPRWPEMGRRYDAPTGGAGVPDAASADGAPVDLWKAIDEGRDPTA